LETALTAARREVETSQRDNSLLRSQQQQTLSDLRRELEIERAKAAQLEQTSTQRISELEEGLHKSIVAYEHLERRLNESTRENDSKVWELKEQLDHANTAKQR
jgi:hypothetical protein